MPSTPISTRNARFQQWQALLGNRTKRHRAAELVVQGVRPITLALEQGWTFTALLHLDSRDLSAWARDVLDRAGAPTYAVAPALLAELGERDPEAGSPELVAVVAMPPDDPTRLPQDGDRLVVAFDRPSGPGNLGALVRSADAFGAAGLVVTGHAADAYDPQAVRASTGSLFALPVIRLEGPADAVDALPGLLRVGLDESGTHDLDDVDLTGATLLVVGNETTGLSRGWRERCDVLARIPMGGSASSLNAANAGTVALYEAARQRRTPPERPVTPAGPHVRSSS